MHTYALQSVVTYKYYPGVCRYCLCEDPQRQKPRASALGSRRDDGPHWVPSAGDANVLNGLRPSKPLTNHSEVKKTDYIKFIDIKTCDLTLSQVMERIGQISAENPHLEIFMDGDSYAIIGRPRVH